MQAYPGQPNPVLAALRGEISTRQLRVMVENLPPDGPLSWALGKRWGDQEWLLHDISSELRRYRVDFINANRDPKKTPALDEPPLMPTPEIEPTAEEEDTRTQDQIQAERDHLAAVLNRRRK